MTTGTTSTTDVGGPGSVVKVFAVELERWRDVRSFSRAAALAKAMNYDRSYVSKVPSGASVNEPSNRYCGVAPQSSSSVHVIAYLQVLRSRVGCRYLPPY